MERKTATTQVRLAPTVKSKAEELLDSMGLSPSSAIELFYKQIIAFKGLPFSPKVINSTTAKAMREVNEGKGSKYHSASDLMNDLEL